MPIGYGQLNFGTRVIVTAVFMTPPFVSQQHPLRCQMLTATYSALGAFADQQCTQRAPATGVSHDLIGCELLSQLVLFCMTFGTPDRIHGSDIHAGSTGCMYIH